MYIHSKFEKFIQWIEALPSHPINIVAAVIFVGITRGFLDSINDILKIPDAPYWSMQTILAAFSHHVVWYTLAFFLFFLVTSAIFPRDKASVRSIAMAGIFFGLLPPLTDLLLHFPLRAYVFFEEFQPFFVSSYQSIGESIIMWLVILTTAAYYGYKGRSMKYFLAGFAVAYAIFQFLAWVLWIFINSKLLGGLVLEISNASGPFLKLTAPHMVITFSYPLLILCGCIVSARRAFRGTLVHVPRALIFGILVILGAWLGAGVTAYAFFKALAFAVGYFLIQTEKNLRTGTSDSLYHPLTARFLMAFLVVVFVPLDPPTAILLGVYLLVGSIAARVEVKHFVRPVLAQALLATVALLAGYIYFSVIYFH